jgi:uncharacterized membrane protein
MRTVLLFIIGLALMACGASRKAVKSDVQEALRVERVQEVERDIDRQENTASTATLSQDETVITRIEEFDTSQPVDPATGTPPLKRRVTQGREQKTNASQQQQTEQTVAEKEKETIDTRVESDTAAQVETIEKRGMNQTQRTLCVVGLLTVLGGLVWLFLKLKKRFYKPF